MKKILLMLFMFLFCVIFSSCNTADNITVCRKDNMSNFGQYSAIGNSENMFYVSNNKIIMVDLANEERVIAKGNDISWITVSDYIYCIEDNDTLVCYDINTGKKLAEYKFEADNIVVKAIDDELLLFTYIKYNFFQRQGIFREKNEQYIVKYSEEKFEVKEFSSGTDFDGGITNKFVALDNPVNTYLYYDDMREVRDPGNGFDDVFYLNGTEYFGMKHLLNDYPCLPFLYNGDIYMSEWYYIVGPFMSDDEKWFELPDSCYDATVIEIFEYNSSMFCIVQDEELFYFVNIDTENRVCEEVGSTDGTDIDTVIGQNNGKIYYTDNNGIVYVFDLLEEETDVFYEPDKSGRWLSRHYEFCGNKLLIFTSGIFSNEVELLDIV